MSATASSSGSVCSYILVDICNWDLFNSNPTKPSWMETEKILIFCSTYFIQISLNGSGAAKHDFLFVLT